MAFTASRSVGLKNCEMLQDLSSADRRDTRGKIFQISDKRQVRKHIYRLCMCLHVKSLGVKNCETLQDLSSVDRRDTRGKIFQINDKTQVRKHIYRLCMCLHVKSLGVKNCETLQDLSVLLHKMRNEACAVTEAEKPQSNSFSSANLIKWDSAVVSCATWSSNIT